MIRRLIACWRFRRELNARLKARKLLRPYRRASAQKGWATRKANA